MSKDRNKNHNGVLAEWGSLIRLMSLGINLKGISGVAQGAASSSFFS